MKSTSGLHRLSNYLKQVSRRNIIITVSIFVFVAGRVARGRYQAHQTNLKTQQDLMYHVTTGDLQVQVKVNAKASLLDEQNLSFGQEGKIAHVNVRVGDEVKAGDVLAELDLKDYQNAIKAAELELENAKLGLSKLLNNDTSLAQAKVRSQIKEAELSLQVESQQYDVLKKQLATTLQQKKDQLLQLNREYDLAKKELDIEGSGLVVVSNGSHASASSTQHATQDREQKIRSIVSDLNAILGDMKLVVESVDKTLGITDVYRYQADDRYRTYISTQNKTLRSKIEKNMDVSYSFIGNFETKVLAMDSSYADNMIYAVVQDMYASAITIITLCDSALDASKMSSALQLLSSTLSTSRSTAISLRSKVKTLRDSLNTILSSYDTQKVSLESQSENIDLLKKEIATLEKDNSNQLARKQAQLQNLNEQVSVLNKELQDVRKGVDAYDIKQQRNMIDQAALRLERTKDQQDDYQIVAEFDGRVRTVDVVEGEQYKLDDKDYIVVENPNLIELKLQVNQVDIVKIKEGQSVVVTFDAYPNTPIEAKVARRNVNPQLNQKGGVYYEAVIVLEKQELEILAGMSALVTVNVAEAKDAILVPTLALVRENNKVYVHLKQGNEYVLHEIQIGIANNFQAEVLSGLLVGDIILASVLDEAALQEMGIDGDGLSFF